MLYLPVFVKTWEFVRIDRSPVNLNDDEIEFILNLGKNRGRGYLNVQNTY